MTSATTKLLNTGRALVIDVDEGVEGLLSGGPLPEEYVLLQVHIIDSFRPHFMEINSENNARLKYLGKS